MFGLSAVARERLLSRHLLSRLARHRGQGVPGEARDEVWRFAPVRRQVLVLGVHRICGPESSQGRKKGGSGLDFPNGKINIIPDSNGHRDRDTKRG